MFAEQTDAQPPVLRRQGVVLLLDALGTKGIALRDEAESIVTRWDEFLRALRRFRDALNNSYGQDVVSLLSFSDSIYLTFAVSDFAEAAVIVTQMADVFFKALVSGIFLRGSVSFGYYYQRGTKVFGPAIDEAAAWYEQTNWFGITATPSFCWQIDLLNLLGTPNLQEYFIRTSAPFKTHPAPTLANWSLAWPRLLSGARNTNLAILLQSFAAHSGVVTPEILPKYEHTLVFFDHCFEQSAG